LQRVPEELSASFSESGRRRISRNDRKIKFRVHSNFFIDRKETVLL